MLAADWLYGVCYKSKLFLYFVYTPKILLHNINYYKTNGVPILSVTS